LRPATNCALFGSLGQPLVIIGILEHNALGFWIGYLIRESASFPSAVEPMLGIGDRMVGHENAI
jgi:hypothetical protein